MPFPFKRRLLRRRPSSSANAAQPTPPPPDPAVTYETIRLMRQQQHALRAQQQQQQQQQGQPPAGATDAMFLPLPAATPGVRVSVQRIGIDLEQITAYAHAETLTHACTVLCFCSSCSSPLLLRLCSLGACCLLGLIQIPPQAINLQGVKLLLTQEMEEQCLKFTVHERIRLYTSDLLCLLCTPLTLQLAGCGAGCAHAGVSGGGVLFFRQH